VGVEIQPHAFLTSAPDGGEWSDSRAGRLTDGKRAPGIHWIGGYLGPSAGLDAVVKRKTMCPLRESDPGRPARSPVCTD
jgi:hypothetical protein